MHLLTTVSVVLFVIACVFVIWMISVYNTLVSLNGQTRRAWANVDVLLKKRWDLVPNLVETVKGYTKHESSTFEQIAQLRQQALGSPDRRQQIAVEQSLNHLLPSVLAWGEQYPSLQSSSNYEQLQQELAQLDEEIADRRELYNAAATDYNVYVRTFPAVLLASSFGSEEAPLFV
ncbi:MAG TPA: LemA family protein, partial [Armatimonadota bacterium]|nr:LemA family protein [Armatimonadota bacterium]